MAWTYTESGNNTASTSWAITQPTASTGDLIIFNVSWDDSTNTTGLTPPSGPNGETAVNIVDVTADSGTNVRGKIVYYIATGAWSAGTLTFTPSASEQWTAVVIKVPAGEFDPSTPIGPNTNTTSSTSTSTPSLPSLTAGSTDAGGTVVGFMACDVDDPDGTITGWTERASTDRGATGLGLWTRDATATNSESISAATGATFPIARAYVGFIFIVRPQHSPTVALSSPADTGSTSDTTPDLVFTGTDADGDDITYEVQVDTVNTFDSQAGSPSATVVQSKAANAGGYVTAPTLQWNSNTTSGNTIIFAITYNDDVTGVVSSITDSQSNTYTKIAGGSSGGDTATELWYAYNITGGTTPTISVTMTVPANSHDFSMNAREMSGFTTTDPFDVKAEGATASGTSHTSATTGTTTQADEYVYGTLGLATNATFTLGSGFSDLSQTNGSDIFQASAAEGKTVSSTGTQQATMTTSAAAVGYFIVATFKLAGGSAPLIDAVSGVDPGFSGSPDNTDPFASAQAVTYTVQAGDTLSVSTTYYWRVRGKDPSGSNTYGAWSSTRSFTVTSGTVTTKSLGLLGVG